MKDCEVRTACYRFPGEHWIDRRTTHPVESSFATLRHRSTRAKNCVTRATFLGLAFQLGEEAANRWRRIRAPERLAELLQGTAYEDGLPVTDSLPEAQRKAA